MITNHGEVPAGTKPDGAEERARTSMGLLPPAPKAGASANFATSAYLYCSKLSIVYEGISSSPRAMRSARRAASSSRRMASLVA